MQTHFEDAELTDVVYGPDPKAESGSLTASDDPSTAMIKLNKKREIRARMILINAIDEKHLAILESCKTAREIWSRLEIEYADREPVTAEALLSELHVQDRFD